jgi:hypothetical protein
VGSTGAATAVLPSLYSTRKATFNNLTCPTREAEYNRPHGHARYKPPNARGLPATNLKPAALGGDQHCLCSIDGAELAVDVVEMGADGARGERQLVGDLLVDLALG